MDGVRFRRRTGVEPELRAGAAQRLPGRADRVAGFHGRRAVSREGAGELRALLLVVEAVSLAVFALFYDAHLWARLGPLALVIALGTWAMTVIGTMFSALTVNLRMRELMLPILVYPLLIPVLMAAMELHDGADLGNAYLGGDNLLWMRVLVAFIVIFTALTLVFIDVVLVG